MPKVTSDMQLSLAEQAELCRFVEEAGERAAVELFKINRSTLARVLGRLPVRRATLAVVRMALVQRAAEGSAR